jgi:hypothetical protein
MAEIAGRLEKGGVAQIGTDLVRRPDESVEPRIIRAKDAPGDAQDDQARDRIARCNMDALDFVSRRIGDDEEGGE